MNKTSDLGLLLTIMRYNKGEIVGRKRFQKIVCILKYRDRIPLSYTFIPYYYGPYSEDLAGTLDFLVGMGLVKEEKRILHDNLYQYTYRLTHEGDELSSSIIRKTNRTLLDRISSAVNEIKDLDTQVLVRFAKEAIDKAGIYVP